MSFIKPDGKFEEVDEYKKLLCTVPGCGRPWAVRIEAPMCSFHQWGKLEYREPFNHVATHNDKGMKAWAYRLKDRHDAGEKLNRNQIESYQEILGKPAVGEIF